MLDDARKLEQSQAGDGVIQTIALEASSAGIVEIRVGASVSMAITRNFLGEICVVQYLR